MRLTIRVPPLDGEDLQFKQCDFALPVHSKDTIEDVWREIEDRYKSNYLEPDQAASFAIKKLQDGWNCDLLVTDTVGSLFSDQEPKDRVINVVPGLVSSLLPTPAKSSLRPNPLKRARKSSSGDSDDDDDDDDDHEPARKRLRQRATRYSSSPELGLRKLFAPESSPELGTPRTALKNTPKTSSLKKPARKSYNLQSGFGTPKPTFYRGLTYLRLKELLVSRGLHIQSGGDRSKARLIERLVEYDKHMGESREDESYWTDGDEEQSKGDEEDEQAEADERVGDERKTEDDVNVGDEEMVTAHEEFGNEQDDARVGDEEKTEDDVNIADEEMVTAHEELGSEEAGEAGEAEENEENEDDDNDEVDDKDEDDVENDKDKEGETDGGHEEDEEEEKHVERVADGEGIIDDEEAGEDEQAKKSSPSISQQPARWLARSPTPPNSESDADSTSTSRTHISHHGPAETNSVDNSSHTDTDSEAEEQLRNEAAENHDDKDTEENEDENVHGSEDIEDHNGDDEHEDEKVEMMDVDDTSFTTAPDAAPSSLPRAPRQPAILVPATQSSPPQAPASQPPPSAQKTGTFKSWLGSASQPTPVPSASPRAPKQPAVLVPASQSSPPQAPASQPPPSAQKTSPFKSWFGSASQPVPAPSGTPRALPATTGLRRPMAPIRAYQSLKSQLDAARSRRSGVGVATTARTSAVKVPQDDPKKRLPVALAEDTTDDDESSSSSDDD